MHEVKKQKQTVPRLRPLHPPRYKTARHAVEQRLVLLAELVLLAGILVAQPWQTAPLPDLADDGARSFASQDIKHELLQAQAEVQQIRETQQANGVQAVDEREAQATIVSISADLKSHHLKHARKKLQRLQHEVPEWDQQLAADVAAKKQAEQEAAAAAARATVRTYVPWVQAVQSWQVPILIYHHPPADLAAQLDNLRAKNYTTVTLDDLAAAMNGRATLPVKPIIITFDDGTADQWGAYQLLQQYSMKATFYIIDGGVASNGCIGAGRTNGSCGDAYLSWDQVRALDQSGLITIGAHTVDHLNLASLPYDQQLFQILSGKQQLEAQLGHAVRHLAYPYGAYNATSIEIARQAGFVTAVTTEPGTSHAQGTQFALSRYRDVYNLP